MENKLLYDFDTYQKDMKEDHLTKEDKEVMKKRWDDVDDLMFSLIFFMTV
ncbi:MAG: hypothetical protein RR614_03470 [Eubacterium sp.]